ncbi:MAG: hypothetical protein M3336_14025, partial [Chloroflexota bacterium]|nr:hypothetical protein [Chloroflexota bacterium]
ARVYNKWTLTWFDPSLEKQAAEALLDPPIQAQLLAQHQDSPATQLAAQDAGKLGIAYNADMNDSAPRATLTAPVWNWVIHNETAVRGVCLSTWMLAGKANIPYDFKYWMGSFQNDTVRLAPLNTAALANHPRKEQIQKLYEDEVSAFKAGQKSFETIFTGPIKDNEGQVRIAGKPDIAALYDQRGQWFVENVVGSATP